MQSNRMLRWTYLHCYSGKKLFLIAIITIIVDILYLLSKVEIEAKDVPLILLEGYGYGYLDLMRFLFFIIVNGIPLYFASLALDNQSLQTGAHVLIRCQSKSRFFAATQVSYILFILGYFLLHAVVGCLFVLIFGLQPECGTYTAELFTELFPQNSVAIIIGLSIILRFLELICFQSLIVFLQSITNKLSIAFICIMCGYLSLIFVPFQYNPFGLSSTMRWTLLNDNMYFGFWVTAAIFCSITILVYLYMFKKGIYQLLER